MEENQTEPSMSQSSTPGSDELDVELKPWIHDLFDIRVIVFLLSTGVIAMTVTVLLLSGDDDVGEGGPSNQPTLTQISPGSKTGLLEGSGDGSAVEVFPGMVASLDVLAGKRTVLEYIWQPMAKVKERAFKD